MNPYNDTGDSNDHVSNFQWAFKMIPMDPKIWCLYFTGTLDGSARYWQLVLRLGALAVSRNYVKSFAIDLYSKEDSNSKPMPYLHADSKRGSRINPILSGSKRQVEECPLELI